MKIIYHHRTQADDAQGIHIYEMVNAFKSLGHQVEMVALVHKDIENDKKLKGRRWEYVANAVPNWIYEILEMLYNIYGFLILFRAVRAGKPDFIYERYSLNTFCGIWISKLFNIPLFLEVNASLYLEQKNLGKLFFKRFAGFSEKWICSNATWTIVVTNVLEKMLIDQGVPPQKLVVMHNAINTERFRPNINKEFTKLLNLDGKIVIGFVGWFRKWHRVEHLLEIFHKNKFGELGAKLLLVGDGPSFDDLKIYVDEHLLKDIVILTGAVPKEDIPDYIAAMDIAVQPDVTPYACPMKILEYMAMGKCIIAPTRANIKELLTHNESGLLFELGNTKSLIKILKMAALNPALRESCGQNALETIHNRRYFWKANAERVCELLN